MSNSKTETVGTAAATTSAYRTAERYAATPVSSSSTGRSVLNESRTIVIRAVTGSSVTVPYNVDQEMARRANRSANREPERGSSTGSSR